MPIPTPYPTVPPTVFDTGSMPALTLSRGGVTLDLDERAGWIILPGVEGLDDPPRALIEVEPAMWDGSLITDARYQPRDVFLPLHFEAPDTASLRSTLRGLAALMDVKRDPVTLTVTHADGTVRTIDGSMKDPYGKTLESGEGARWRRVGVLLHCGDPFYSGAPRSLQFSLGSDVYPFLGDEFLPVQVANSQVLGQIVAHNPGDADAYPVWELTGPCDSATIALAGTQWTVPDGLNPGETLTVDARRGAPYPVTCNSTPAWGRLGPGATLGALAPGDNPLTVAVPGSLPATGLRVSWRDRWLTAW